MWNVYILKSLSAAKTYVGATEDLEARIEKHNAGGSTFTRRFLPWKLVYTEEFPEKKTALEREKYFKSSAGRRKMKTILQGS